MTLEHTILTALKPSANKRRAEHEIRYLHSHFPTLGCTVPQIRSVAKRIFGDLQNNDSQSTTRAEISKLFLSTTSHDVMTVCLMYFDEKRSTLDLHDWKIFKKWATRIDNWAHADYLSGYIAHLLERFPSNVYPTLKTWNTHKNPWLRRLSLTSLLYYANARTKPIAKSKIFPLIKARLYDTDPYVQKAVGWQLRECGNLWPQETKAFIKKHVNDLSSMAFSYATEKWTREEKEPVKQQRKEQRKKR